MGQTKEKTVPKCYQKPISKTCYLAIKINESKKNVSRLFEQILSQRNLQLYKISMDKKEFDRFKGLLNGDQVHELASDFIVNNIRKRGIANLQENGVEEVFLVHDPCDIRKPYSSKLESLGKVRSLEGEIISGYRTSNTIAINGKTLSLELLDHITYSNREENFVSRAELETYNNDNWHELEAKTLKSIHQNSYLNTQKLYKTQSKQCSDLLKQEIQGVRITHIQDREFDSSEYFKYIDQELGDKFITRLKKNKKSHETKPKYTNTGKLSKNKENLKLVNKEFKNTAVFNFSKIRMKGKIHQNVKLTIQWEPFVIQGHRIYTVVRLEFIDRKGQNIFKDPMLLITNREVGCKDLALGIYKAYLLRSKIEALFKFLKQELGWEKIQVRDFKSIKNLLAVGFYVAGYFHEIEEIISEIELYRKIADLGGGKGKFTKVYFMRGLAKICNYKIVLQQIRQMSEKDIEELLDFVQINQGP